MAAHQRTAEFDEGSRRAARENNHATKPGVRGVNHIVSGRLRHRMDGLGAREIPLDPERPGLVAPAVVHRVAPDGPVRISRSFAAKPDKTG
ncbi:DUF1971 domain-containing protein [Sorangium sp. So ce385]|uniref:DUF1971 domain-containing protein n=1 Tax=Sorangium sp. So ce385 TaxID=3133308 RepID=UPI003F5B9001